MLHWNDVIHPHLGEEKSEILARARIGFVGAGGLGSNCALLLARCGIRRFVVADGDVVSVSNLNRQFFTPAQIGRLKVDALCENLNAMFAGSEPPFELKGHACWVTPDNTALFTGCDVVVEAVDDAATKRLLIDALLEAGHCVVSASGMAGWGHDMGRRRMGRLSVVGDFSRAVGEGMPPMAPRVTMAAAMQADEVLWRLLEHFNIEISGGRNFL